MYVGLGIGIATFAGGDTFLQVVLAALSSCIAPVPSRVSPVVALCREGYQTIFVYAIGTEDFFELLHWYPYFFVAFHTYTFFVEKLRIFIESHQT